MVDSTYSRTAFTGGEWSQAMQGRFDRDDYPTAMNVCLNGLPTEGGQWVRRSGTRWAGETRNGQPGRVVSFSFRESTGYKIEFTDGFMRFRVGPRMVHTNDEVAIASISSASPAVFETASAHGWNDEDQLQVFDTIAETHVLLNRTLRITIASPTTFIASDAVTGVQIDGTDIASTNSGTLRRVREIVSPYVGDSWGTLRVVQTDVITPNGSAIAGVILHGSYQPHVLQVASDPTEDDDATFTFNPAVMKDGPYLDPVPGGTLATPSAVQGVINLTLSFNAYDATKAYAKGDYVTSASVNYKSLTDANVGNTPASSPSDWVAVAAADAIGPKGFQGGDVGRMVRLFSEPEEWLVGSTYALGQRVRYGNPSTYWVSLVGSNVGNQPGLDLTKWIISTNAVVWTWGKITSLSNTIDRSLSGSTNFGDMVNNGGVNAVFNGNFAQLATNSAQEQCPTTIASPGDVITNDSYVGKNYSGASAQVVQSATVYPSSDYGLFGATYTAGSGITILFKFNLYASHSAPIASNDGTLLGSFGFVPNTTQPLNIPSNDTTTAWEYVWIEMQARFVFSPATLAGGGTITFSQSNIIGQVSFFAPPGTGTSDGVALQILGDPLLYTTPIRTWRLGLYSDTTGWPACGTYHEGRLWLSGAVDNRIDGSMSNEPFIFSPTGPDGTVAGNNGISYVFNSKDINPIFWMESDDLGIICGTQGGEWLVQATTINAPLTPLSIQAHRVTKYGCANVEPARTELTLAVVQTFKKQVLEFFGEVNRGKFSAQDLSFFHRHLTRPGIEQVAFQKEMVPTIWHRTSEGKLFGMTYRRESLVSSREPDARGAHRVTLGTARTVESIAVGPNADGSLDELAIVTAAAAPSYRYVELMQPLFEEGDELENAFFLDAAIVPPTYSVGADDITVYGLAPHNGKTVAAFCGGLYVGNTFVVADGEITIPLGDGVGGTAASLFTQAFVDGFAGAMPVVVGFNFTSQAQPVRPMVPFESGARTGPALGKTRRNNRFAVLIQNAIKNAVKFGGSLTGTLFPAIFKTPGGTEYAPDEMFSGIYKDALQDAYSHDGMVAWQISDPYPATIAAIQGFGQTTDA